MQSVAAESLCGKGCFSSETTNVALIDIGLRRLCHKNVPSIVAITDSPSPKPSPIPIGKAFELLLVLKDGVGVVTAAIAG